MKTIRTLLVDDEPLALQGMQLDLARVRGFEVVGTAHDGEEAVARIRALRPDLVLLDIQLPGLDGFQVLEALGGDELPAVVFITAYDEHAIRAFRHHALDYLLKPVDAAALRDSLRVVAQRLHRGEGMERGVRALLQALQQERPIQRILIRDSRASYFIDIDDVDWFAAEDNYVRVHARGRSHLLRYRLKELEQRLDPHRFVRIHRSIIVNLARVSEVQPYFKGDYFVRLRDGTQLRLSRTFRDQFFRGETTLG